MRIVTTFIALVVLHMPAVMKAQVDHWETAVYAEDTWRYFVGTSEPPTDWRDISFDESAWPEGQGSIGYGDGDDNTIISPTESLYMRRVFSIVDPGAIEEVLLHADFDDGFVAYLNGVEVARTNMEGNPPAFNSWATDLREAQMYNGGLPVKYIVSNEIISQHLAAGENVLAIQTHNFDGLVSSDMTTLYWLSFGIKDQSSNYGPVPSWFAAPIDNFTSDLPILRINTFGASIPDEPIINAEMGIIWNGLGNKNSSDGVPNEFLGNIAIERRGQSSQWFPKTGYGFETRDATGLDLDTAFLNFPSEEDWVLHGPYSDKTLIRNVLAMEIANRMGQYASRTRLVELVLNDSYEGVYVLMEKIKRDKNRVDIATLRPEDIDGDELTGGYVIKIDKGEPDWLSQYSIVYAPERKIAYQYVSPNRNKIQPAQAYYIQQFMRDFEDAMRSPHAQHKGKYYYEYMDITSFADHFIISEITRNVDAYRLSTYLHKDKDSNDGLLKMGPIWDYNLGFGNADYCDGSWTAGWMYDLHCDVGNPFWWENLFAEPRFWNAVKCRWDDFRSGPLSTESLFAFIDEQTALLEEAQVRNFNRWPILNEYVWPNAVITGSYEGEIEFLKGFLDARLNWMDSNIHGECLVTSIETPAVKQLNIYPNPSSGQLNFQLPMTTYESLSVFLVGLDGKRYIPEFSMDGGSTIAVNFSGLNLKEGMYLLEVRIDNKEAHKQKVIVYTGK